MAKVESYAGVFLQDRQGYFIYGIHAYGYPIGEISRLLPDGSTDTSFGTNGPLQIQGGFRFKALQLKQSITTVAGQIDPKQAEQKFEERL